MMLEGEGDDVDIRCGHGMWTWDVSDILCDDVLFAIFMHILMFILVLPLSCSFVYFIVHIVV